MLPGKVLSGPQAEFLKNKVKLSGDRDNTHKGREEETVWYAVQGEK